MTMERAIASRTSFDRSKMSAGQFVQAGSAYYFKGWGGIPEEAKFPKFEAKNQKDSWKSWTKLDAVRPTSSASGSINDDVTMTCKIDEAREKQKAKAHQVALACTSGRGHKAALMFQRRFERSERFALVKEPEVRKETTEVDDVIKMEASDVIKPDEPGVSDVITVEEPIDVTTSEQQEITSQDVASPGLPKELQQLMTSLCARPWEFPAHPSLPQPQVKDFNRRPRGFTGTYVSPYGAYFTDEGVYESGDL